MNHHQLLSLGGLAWLLIPLIGFACLAGKQAYSSVKLSNDIKEKFNYKVYLITLVSSIVYFIIVSYTRLTNWIWGFRVFQSVWVAFENSEPEQSNKPKIEWYDWDPIMDWDVVEEAEKFDVLGDTWINKPSNFSERVDRGGINVIFEVDGRSLSLILLTAFIVPLCIIYCKHNVHSFESMAIYIVVREILRIVAFWTRDFMVFFIMFEIIMWPMYRRILTWGAHEQKKKAAMSFILYTIFGSLIRIIVIIVSLLTFKTTSINMMLSEVPENVWWGALLWMPAFVAFAVKVPTWPFHHWRTLAHVEAPTVGSVILAARLLKIGSYGFLRFMLPRFNDPVNFWQLMPRAATLCLMSVIFAALMAISQSDLKRIVAYSSIAHMNFSLIGLRSRSDRAIMGGTILFIAHGFVSAAMFFSVGMRYDRYHQRDLLYYRGRASVAPVFSIIYFLTNRANLGVPRSFNFLGEFLIFTEVMNIYYWAAPRLIFARIIQVGYTMKLISILFGDTIQFTNAGNMVWSDITLHELGILVMLVVPTYYRGVQGGNFIELMVHIDPILKHEELRYTDEIAKVLELKESSIKLSEPKLW